MEFPEGAPSGNFGGILANTANQSELQRIQQHK